MKYMLQVRFNGAEERIRKLPPDEQQSIFAEFEALQRMPGVVDANQLQPTETASTVSVEGGRANVADGLPVPPDLAIDGYYLYDAPDLEAAVQFAAQIPATRLGATVEIRPTIRR